MRASLSIAVFAALISSVSPAQAPFPQSPLIPAPVDTRPFGKYLVRVCSLSSIDGPITVTCAAPPASVPAVRVSQTIKIQQVGCPSGTPQNKCPDPVYPVQVGSTIYVSASSDSGLPVTQRVVAGDVNPRGGSGTQGYFVSGPGTIVIRATQNGDTANAPAVPVELVLTVSDDSSSKADTCSGLFAAPKGQVHQTITADQLIKLVGTPTPFTLASQGSDVILIYSSRFPPFGRENLVLADVEASLEQFAGRTAASLGITSDPNPFKVELRIPHAAALGDLATRINTLNFSNFTVQDVGNDSVRITAKAQPDCDTWTAFLTDVRRMVWQITPSTAEAKLFFLSGSDVVTAFNIFGSGSGSTPSATPSPPSGSASPSSGSSGGSPASPTIAINQPPGSRIDVKSDTTPCVIAGLELSNSSACTPASASGTPSSGSGGSGSSGGGGATANPPKPPGMASLGAAVTGGVQPLQDLLVFSSANPGDDSQIEERKRILAQLDLPRPEMQITAWVMQNSTSDPSAIGQFSNAVRNLVVQYNDAIEDVVNTAWRVVQDQIASGNYFNEPFYHYVSDVYMANPQADSDLNAAQQFLDASPQTIKDSAENLRDKYGICSQTQYCLGYRNLFLPLKPRLTDLLLSLIAADQPPQKAPEVIAAVQGDPTPIESDDMCAAQTSDRELAERCRTIFAELGLRNQRGENNCVIADYQRLLGWLLGNPRSRVQLMCFASEAHRTQERFPLLRGVIANFLYNYKHSQQYPHEFRSYDLSQSADALNAALAPLIDAFIRDIISFQTFMRADVQYKIDQLNNELDRRCCVGRLFGRNKPYFYNEGLVSVRTISGVQSTVNTTSQSVLDASSAPSLSDILSSINSAGGASGSAANAAAAVGSLGGPQAAIPVLAGILNAYQTTRVQIGRQLNLAATPRSLATASAAEIAVTLNADESANPSYFTSGPNTNQNQNTSRVGTHDTTTRIRVESMRLFELSSYAAVVQRSRSKFPIIPPFIEIPYIGTLAGIPIPGAKEYHGSTAILSAIVVPTAADIAYGLRFGLDLVVDGEKKGDCSYVKGSAGMDLTPCRFRRAISISDLKKPIQDFHEAMVNCLETNMKSPYSSFSALTNTTTGTCQQLSFDDVRR